MTVQKNRVAIRMGSRHKGVPSGARIAIGGAAVGDMKDGRRKGALPLPSELHYDLAGFCKTRTHGRVVQRSRLEPDRKTDLLLYGTAGIRWDSLHAGLDTQRVVRN